MKTKLILLGIMAVVGSTACNQIQELVGVEQASSNVRSIGRDQVDTSRRQRDYSSEQRGLDRVDRVNRADSKEKRYALVIGNSNYIGDPNIKSLKNPVNDARDMRKALEEVGFEVVYRENVPNEEQMENAVQEFSQKLESGGVGLFYYAGHGIQAHGINYLIPTRVSIPTQVELKHRAMPANYVLEKMEYARNDLNIIILDACRNNPLPTRGRSVSKSGLAPMDNPAGSILIYSTAAGDRAYDGKGRNGVFTKHLLRGIKNYAYMPVEAMLKKVRIAVEQETINEPVPQIPWQNSSLKRDFCFSQSGCVDPKAEIARQQLEQAELARQRAEEQAREARREIEEAKRQAAKAKQQNANSSNSPNLDEAAILEAARIIQESKQRAKAAEEQARQAQIDADRRIQEAERKVKKAKEAAAEQAPQRRSRQSVFVSPAF